MLKNNEERQKYIHDENNWDVLTYDIVTSEYSSKESEKELHGGLITGIPEIRLKRLKGTSVYKIEVLAAPFGYRDNNHFVEIGLKVFKTDGRLNSVYDLTLNQLIAYLREHKV